MGFDHAAALKDSKDAKIPSNIGKHDISEAAAMLQREDVTDKQVQKDKLRAKRQKKRLRHKEVCDVLHYDSPSDVCYKQFSTSEHAVSACAVFYSVLGADGGGGRRWGHIGGITQ